MKKIFLFLCLTAVITVGYNYIYSNKETKILTSILDKSKPNFDNSSVNSNINNAHKKIEKHSHEEDNYHSHEEDSEHVHSDIELIKNRLCSDKPTSLTCFFNTEIDIESEIFETDSDISKVKEIGVLLSSENFNDFLSTLESSKTTNYAEEKEVELNFFIDEMNNNNVQTKGIKCGNKACAGNFVYKNNEEWNAFLNNLLEPNEEIGNIFLHNSTNGVRLLFLLNNKKAVTK